MAGLTWIVTRSFTRPTAVTAASEQSSAGFPAANLLSLGRPFLVWRSVGTTDVAIIFDFGTAVQIARVVLNNANFASAVWAAGDNGSTFGTALGTFAVPVNPEVAPRRIACQPLAMAAAHRYLRLTPTTLDAGASYAELGEALFLTSSALAPLEQNVGLPTGGADQMIEPLPFTGGGYEANADGPPFKRYVLEQANWRIGTNDANLNMVRAWLASGRTVPHLVYENRGEDGQGTSPLAYLVLIEGYTPQTQLSGKHFTTSPITAREKFG